MSASSITISDLSCTRCSRRIFAPVSFSLNAGGVVILRGENGSGKSTLLRALAGLIPSTAAPLPSALYLGHANALHPSMNADEHLDFWRSLHTSTAISNTDILNTLGLLHQRDKLAAHLSNGQKRRLSFGRLLLQQADCWLLDEPQAALDTSALEMLLKLITTHTAKGGMAIIASHDEIPLVDAQTIVVRAAA